MVDIFWVVLCGGEYIFDGGGWWSIYSKWWWAVVDLSWAVVNVGAFILGGAGR